MLVKCERESTGSAVNSLSINSNVNTEYNAIKATMSNFISQSKTAALQAAQAAFVLFCAGLLGLSLAGG
jgi:NAD/NADP transhydrogenase alpha subunit